MSGRLWQYLKRITGDAPNRRPEAAEVGDDRAHPTSPAAAAPVHAPHLPRSFLAGTPSDGASRPRRFDPALLHYRSAFRPGDPEFDDPEVGLRWAGHRRRITDHVLRRIAESTAGDRLILRGSRLLKAWLHDSAREPGDLDWVSDLGRTGVEADRLFDALIEAVFDGPTPEGIALDRGGVATDEIWTYDRVPGRRAVFPWRAPGLPGGGVQVDVTFGEALSIPSTRLALMVADGGCVSVRAASREQSLAWKLLWLWTDVHGQGKDLYDAALLAERCSLTRETLEATFRNGGEGRFDANRTASDFTSQLNVEWDHFAAEYPWVEGDEAHWMGRLERAIGPLFGVNLSPRSLPGLPIEGRPTWITPRVVDAARGILAGADWDDLPILRDALLEGGCDRPDLLDHCLRAGPHTQGCGAIDQILQSSTSRSI